MIVVYDEPLPVIVGLLADGAYAPLARRHVLELIVGEAVGPAQVAIQRMFGLCPPPFRRRASPIGPRGQGPLAGIGTALLTSAAPHRPYACGLRTPPKRPYGVDAHPLLTV